jgi:hypothetical protein
MQHRDGIGVETAGEELGRKGIVDEIAEGIGRSDGGVEGADHVDEADVGDAVGVEGGGWGEVGEVERGAPACRVFPGEVAEVGGVDGAVGSVLEGGGREGDGWEADEVGAIGTDFDEGEFREDGGACGESVFEDGEVRAWAIADRFWESDGDAAAVAEAEDRGGWGSGG